MLKNISNLKGTQTLTNDEQKTIKGGFVPDLSKLCGAKTFRSSEDQCLSMIAYNPIWDPYTRMCSVVGHNCSGGEL